MAKLNIKPNAMFTGDNLCVLNGMNSECIDLIYLDPPFNSKRTYEAPIGSRAAGARFNDIWKWQDVDEYCLERLMLDYPYMVQFIQSIEAIHGKAMMSYITFMTQRLIELHRVLKPTGSLYLHCDTHASHYLKIILDRVFGKNNFRNEVVWCYSTSGRSKKHFAIKHDNIYFYSKTDDYYWSDYRIPVSDEYLKSHYRQKDEQGRQCRIRKDAGKVRIYYPEDGMICNDWWEIPYVNSRSKERTGYRTQKPLALLKRIIEASSKLGDVILDPFCGCATAMVAAQNVARKWIGIDVEKKAAELVVERLSGELPFNDFIHRTDFPQRTDVEKVRETKSVKMILYSNQHGACNGCGDKLDDRHLEIDHIIPKSRGGGDYIENYQLLCGNCNRVKGDRPMDYLRLKISKRQDALKQVSFGA